MRVSEAAAEAEEKTADDEVTEAFSHHDMQTDFAVDLSTKAA